MLGNPLLIWMCRMMHCGKRNSVEEVLGQTTGLVVCAHFCSWSLQTTSRTPELGTKPHWEGWKLCNQLH